MKSPRQKVNVGRALRSMVRCKTSVQMSWQLSCVYVTYSTCSDPQLSECVNTLERSNNWTWFYENWIHARYVSSRRWRTLNEVSVHTRLLRRCVLQTVGRASVTIRPTHVTELAIRCWSYWEVKLKGPLPADDTPESLHGAHVEKPKRWRRYCQPRAGRLLKSPIVVPTFPFGQVMPDLHKKMALLIHNVDLYLLTLRSAWIQSVWE